MSNNSSLLAWYHHRKHFNDQTEGDDFSESSGVIGLAWHYLYTSESIGSGACSEPADGVWSIHLPLFRSLWSDFFLMAKEQKHVTHNGSIICCFLGSSADLKQWLGKRDALLSKSNIIRWLNHFIVPSSGRHLFVFIFWTFSWKRKATVNQWWG